MKEGLQNNMFEELRKKREEWVEASRKNGFEDGIKNLLTDLYPDNAHFIYELLQNAEDAGASKVKFILEKDKAIFEHNGDRLFSLEDVEAITSIGFSNKKDDHTKIGKFGIGFKAVFAYTETPEIESGNFHFRIRDIVIPESNDLPSTSLDDRITRFIFPFNNSKKSQERACSEVEASLRKLDENTLLFLSNIKKVEYQLPDSTIGFLELKKDQMYNDHIKIIVKTPTENGHVSKHFLRFEKIVSIKDSEENDRYKDCKIAIAFGLDKIDDKWKIISLNPGQVCIYFPAAKETSNLRFHMHAPFASTVARDSVRECPANDELRDHLATLIADSMCSIRDKDLMKVDFLATLPNDRDNLRTFYIPIQNQLVKKFNGERLVPMKSGGYGIASKIYRGLRSLSDLISDSDLATLLGNDNFLPLWIANPPQINQREDNFLSMLDVTKWDVEDLIDALDTEDDSIIEWLKQKPIEWHQDFYAFLNDSPSYYHSKFSKLRIVRCDDGEYRTGNECHFGINDVEPVQDLLNTPTAGDEERLPETPEEENEEGFHYVDNATYTSGNKKDKKDKGEKAREFLESIGVKDVDETERIKLILKQRYVKGTIPLREPYYKQDLERFIKLVEDEPDKAVLFENYHIFQSDKSWSIPNRFFLDLPYCNTGLTVYHKSLDKDSDSRKLPLSQKYKDIGIDLERLAKFAETVGAQTKLEAILQEIPCNHAQRDYLYSAEGFRRTCTGIDEDYSIPEFQTLFDNPSINKSKLIWRTMCTLSNRTYAIL